MNQNQHKRSAFSGKIGFVLSAAGASAGASTAWGAAVSAVAVVFSTSADTVVSVIKLLSIEEQWASARHTKIRAGARRARI